MIAMARRIGYQWFVHDNTSAAASIAFYSLFTLAPTLIFGVAVGAWALGAEEARTALRAALVDVVTPQQADALLQLVNSTVFEEPSFLASLVTGVLLLYGASAVFVQLRIALNRIFDLSVETIHEQIHTTIVGRLVAALFVILIGAIEVGVVALNVFIRWASQEMSDWGLWTVQLARVTDVLISWLVLGLLFAGILRYLPMRSPPWRHVWPGAVVSLVLFQAGKHLIGLYLSHATIASAYGASGSLVAIMIWIYYSMQTLLLGAEVTHDRVVLARERESAESPPPQAAPARQ